MTKEDLQLVSYDDLLDELNSRFDIYIFAGIKRPVENDEEAELSYHGGKFVCIGLCLHLIDMLKLKCRDLIVDKDDDGEQPA
jgi:hypothetical protein